MVYIVLFIKNIIIRDIIFGALSSELESSEVMTADSGILLEDN